MIYATLILRRDAHALAASIPDYAVNLESSAFIQSISDSFGWFKVCQIRDRPLSWACDLSLATISNSQNYLVHQDAPWRANPSSNATLGYFVANFLELTRFLGID